MPLNWKTAVSPKQVLDLSKDVSIIIEGKDGTIGFYTLTLGDIDKAITKAEKRIKQFEMTIYKLDAGTALVVDDINDIMKEIAVNQERNGNVKQAFNLEIQMAKEYIELFKIKKLIYTSVIKEKDLTKLGDLFLTKMRTTLSNILEITEELVSLGRLKETEYLDDANDARDAYNKMEAQTKLYNQRKDMIITNAHIKVIRR